MSSEILSESVSSIRPKTGTGCPRMPDANRPANALEQVPATWSPLRRRQLGEEQCRPSEPRKHDETSGKTPKRDLSPFFFLHKLTQTCSLTGWVWGESTYRITTT